MCDHIICISLAQDEEARTGFWVYRFGCVARKNGLVM